jgi:hypothetical protein
MGQMLQKLPVSAHVDKKLRRLKPINYYLEYMDSSIQASFSDEVQDAQGTHSLNKIKNSICKTLSALNSNLDDSGQPHCPEASEIVNASVNPSE